MNGPDAGATPIEDEKLELKFDAAMQEIYWLAGKATGYWASYFLRSVRKNGGLAVARQLLWKNGVSAGFGRLKAEGRLDLSMGALMLKPVFRPLFAPNELARARERMREHGYEPASQ